MLTAELATTLLPPKSLSQPEVLGSSANDSGRDWRALLMLRCQLLAGRSLDASPRLLIRDLREAVRDLPPEIGVRDRLLIRGILGCAFARIVRASELDRRAEMTGTLLDWLMSSATSDSWYQELSRVLDMWSVMSGDRDDSLVQTQSDRRVERVLRFLDVRYRDADVRLVALADQANVSAWHARGYSNDTPDTDFSLTSIAVVWRLLVVFWLRRHSL